MKDYDAEKKHFYHFNDIEREIVKGFESTAWIQWKGTEVCIDIHCKCGKHSHIDAEFFYYFRCECGQLYWPQTTIAMIPIDGEHAKFVEDQGRTIHVDDSIAIDDMTETFSKL